MLIRGSFPHYVKNGSVVALQTTSPMTSQHTLWAKQTLKLNVWNCHLISSKVQLVLRSGGGVVHVAPRLGVCPNLHPYESVYGTLVQKIISK